MEAVAGEGTGLKLGESGGVEGKRGGWRGWVRASWECCDCFGASLGSRGGHGRTCLLDDEGGETESVDSELERTRGNSSRWRMVAVQALHVIPVESIYTGNDRANFMLRLAYRSCPRLSRYLATMADTPIDPNNVRDPNSKSAGMLSSLSSFYPSSLSS